MLNAVEISNLTVKYPEVVALDDVSFVIEQGDFLGIIGPNGAGKSTLFDSMLGLNTTYTGTIKFFDEDIKKSKTYHQEIGYVPQKPEFESNFPATVSDVVRMGLRKKSDDNKVDEILQQLMLHELRDRRIGALSGGQLQRVFIAKALVHDPKILILDEPNTGVDMVSQKRFYKLLSKLNKEENITILFITHDVGVIADDISRLFTINQKINICNSPKETLSCDEMSTLYGIETHSIHQHKHHEH